MARMAFKMAQCVLRNHFLLSPIAVHQASTRLFGYSDKHLPPVTLTDHTPQVIVFLFSTFLDRWPLMPAFLTRLPALLLALAVTALLPAAHAADAAAPKDVSYPSGTETVHALLYQPSKSAGALHPAIIVIHEWWGLNDWVKEQASDLAKQGYVVLAVDLYRGEVANDPDTAHQLSRGLPQDRGIRDLKAAEAYLSSQRNIDRNRIGAIGWCMGGGYALNFAVADPHLKAVVANYGPPPTDPASLAQIHAAILGNYGGLDKGIPAASVESFASEMKKLGKSVDMKIYPDAGHAFENPNNKAGYRADDAADAHVRNLRFFARELGGRP